MVEHVASNTLLIKPVSDTLPALVLNQLKLKTTFYNNRGLN